MEKVDRGAVRGCFAGRPESRRGRARRPVTAGQAGLNKIEGGEFINHICSFEEKIIIMIVVFRYKVQIYICIYIYMEYEVGIDMRYYWQYGDLVKMELLFCLPTGRASLYLRALFGGFNASSPSPSLTSISLFLHIFSLSLSLFPLPPPPLLGGTILLSSNCFFFFGAAFLMNLFLKFSFWEDFSGYELFAD